PCDDSFNVKPIPAPVQVAWSASPGFSVTALHGPADWRLSSYRYPPEPAGWPSPVHLPAGRGMTARSPVFGLRMVSAPPVRVGSATPPGVPARITGSWES